MNQKSEDTGIELEYIDKGDEFKITFQWRTSGYAGGGSDTGTHSKEKDKVKNAENIEKHIYQCIQQANKMMTLAAIQGDSDDTL